MFSNVSIFFSASCDLLWSIWQVGYLLGLGDRHPSNLMLDRHRYISPCSMPFFAHLGWRIDCWLQISWYPYNFLFHVHNIYGFKISRHAFLSFSFYSKLFPKQEFIHTLKPRSLTSCSEPLTGTCSGKILHIDFGDCFEASMSREKFPEKVRLFVWIHVAKYTMTLSVGLCHLWMK